MSGHNRTAIVIGAGPAGLTAAYELLSRSDIHPIVLEMSGYMGGIARTVEYKGNRIDIGGHRFFSKSDRVMEWWLKFLPLQKLDEPGASITYQRQHRPVPTTEDAPDPNREDRVMLVRRRLSRVLFGGRFFPYPVSLNVETVRGLGLRATLTNILSYLYSTLFPVRPEKSLEDFFVNRFGRRLYVTFFRGYTEKIWGVPCSEISADWGAQRVKALSLYEVFVNLCKGAFPGNRSDISQKNKQTSMIETFLYPKLGPGQLWEEVAVEVRVKGGAIHTGWRADRIEHENSNRITAICATNLNTGERRRFAGDFFFSTMPIQELMAAFEPPAPPYIRQLANGLKYRNFIIVGLLCRRLKEHLNDTWIYIQDPTVHVGRLQVFNNWSPYMVADPSTVWLGLEYFCDETDDLWKMQDSELIQLAKTELRELQFVEPEDVIDGTVVRMPKAYPAYFGTYDKFAEIRDFTDQFENLFLIGRNGMHRYNNQDHSMLAAMMAVDQIMNNVSGRDELWALNSEPDYQEEK